MNDIKKTQHYSKEQILIDGLLEYIPLDAILVEPFYGEGNLVHNTGRTFSEYYDISFPEENEHHRDTLLSPPDYSGKWIITNPPYLAKNKAKDKKYFKKEKYDDLYKIAINTFLKADGGILIIPVNFFADERSKNIREKFFENFQIFRLNIFLDSMFENTDYNVCSFVFGRINHQNSNKNIPTFIYKNKNLLKETTFSLLKEYDYRLGGEFFWKIKQNKNVFSRITLDKPDNATNISVVCIDKTNEPLHFYYSEEPFYGKESDRNVATLSYKGELTKEQQMFIVNRANEIIKEFRKNTYNLCLTNYRDRNRKRIGFTEAYQIATMALCEYKA